GGCAGVQGVDGWETRAARDGAEAHDRVAGPGPTDARAALVPLADHIDTQIQAILALWRAAVDRGGDVPEAETLTYSEFADNIPALLGRLAERLRGRPLAGATEGKEHGRVRWRQGYDVVEVVGELAHLRAALRQFIFDYALKQGFDTTAQHEAYSAISHEVDETTAEAVRQFQADSAAATRAAWAKAEDHQRAVEAALIATEAARAKLRAILENL